MYILTNASSSLVAFLSARDSTPNMEPRDLEPYSVDARRQIWLLEQNRDGWYIIKSFPFGLALGMEASGSNVKLLCAVNDTSSKFQWKFLQDTLKKTVRCVCRLRPEFALAPDAKGVLGFVEYTGDASQQWQLSRSTGGSTDTKLPEGTYLISLVSFTDPSASLVRTALQSVANFLGANNTYYKNVTDIASAATDLSTSLSTTYPPPSPLPIGVDTEAFDQGLAVRDPSNGLQVAQIVSWFYAVLCAASVQDPQKDSKAKMKTAAELGQKTDSGDPVPTRTVAVSAAVDQISNLLIALSNTYMQTASKQSRDNATADTVKQINTITTETQLLTDTTAATIQANLSDTGSIFLQK